MSDHADFEDLLEHVREVAPRRVVTLHGFAQDFARILQARGVSAEPLAEQEGARGERMTAYRLLAETLDAVAESRGKLAKIERLAAALSAVDADGSQRAAARLLSGSAFAESDAATTSVGSATVVRAGAAVTGWDEETLYACAAAMGDLGEAIGLLRPPVAASITIPDVEGFFQTLSRTRKPADKRALLESLLSRAGPVETKYLLKTLTGSMRVGADLATIEEAIAAAFGEPREAVARARRDSGDIGETRPRPAPIA